MGDIALFKKILEIHKNHLNNLKLLNKRLLICFSAIPCSGKTYVSKILEEKYKGVRINNDDIRDVIKSLIPGKSKEILEERQEILQQYLIWFLIQYNFPNKLLILDSSIDRKYRGVRDFADKHRYSIFIISLKISREFAHKRSLLRNNGKEDDNFVENIDRWIKENKELASKVSSDIVLLNEGNLDLSRLFLKLDKIIKF